MASTFKRADMLGQLSNAVEMLASARENRDRQIVNAADFSISYRTIAKETGLSHQRIAQIVSEARAAKSRLGK